MANPEDKKTAALRAAWDKAIEKDKPKDALAALEGLEALDARDPRWPHRRGDVLRRLSRPKDAEAAYGRAIDLYNQQGFLARAVAVAKLIVEINPSRASLLDSLDQDAARSLRRASLPAGTAGLIPPPPAKLEPPSPAPPPAPPPASRPEPAPADGAPAEAPRERPSYLAFKPAEQVRGVATAMHLAPAADVAKDEVRFGDVPEENSVEISITDIADASPEDYELGEEELGDDELEGDDELGDDDIEIVSEPSAERLSLMTATTFFAEVPHEALSEVAKASSLIELPDGEVVFRHGQVADALFVVVEGGARVVVPGIEGGGVDVAEGHVFGENSLLENGRRQADVTVVGRLVALRIPKGALDGIVASYPAVGDVLFDVLIQRLLAITLQTSALFAAFDPEQRKELARLFEVRRAARGVLVTEFGKRSDGLYLALAGDLEIEDGSGTRRMQLGSMFGQESLLSQAPARRTVRVLGEAVLLRMPLSRFGTFAMQYPPALAHISDLGAHGGV